MFKEPWQRKNLFHRGPFREVVPATPQGVLRERVGARCALFWRLLLQIECRQTLGKKLLVVLGIEEPGYVIFLVQILVLLVRTGEGLAVDIVLIIRSLLVGVMFGVRLGQMFSGQGLVLGVSWIHARFLGGGGEGELDVVDEEE